MRYRDHGRRILLLLLLAVLVQSWMVARNDIPAQDSLVFLRFARQFQHQPFWDTLRSNSQHPLFPIFIWLFHHVFGGCLGSDANAWIRSAQCVAAIATIVLAVPMYLAGLRLGGAELATSATAVFTVLPLTARMGADALADSTYLLFMLVACWSSIEFLLTHRLCWAAIAGTATGFAFLARPESLVLPLAVAVTLVLTRVWSGWQGHWLRLIGACSCGLGAMILVTLPYLMGIGRPTPKRSLNLLPHGAALFARFDTTGGRPALRTLNDGRSIVAPARPTALPPPPDGMLDFALQHRQQEQRSLGYAAAGRELARELVEGLHYVIGMLAVIGVFKAERRPANLLCSTLAILFLGLLLQFASRSGYVASRHVVTVICLGCYAAARGGQVLIGAIARLVENWCRFTSTAPASLQVLIDRVQRRWAVALIVIVSATCLPKSLKSLHQSREAHVAAASWLADHAAADSIVLDSRGWASLLAGISAYDYNGARLAFQDPRLAYVVLEDTELKDDRPRGSTLRHLLGLAGQKLAEFRSTHSSSESVEIFGWYPERLVPREGAAGAAVRAN